MAGYHSCRVRNPENDTGETDCGERGSGPPRALPGCGEQHWIMNLGISVAVAAIIFSLITSVIRYTTDISADTRSREIIV
nr:hypothetical protein [uncultured Methanoregula sp.]